MAEDEPITPEKLGEVLTEAIVANAKKSAEKAEQNDPRRARDYAEAAERLSNAFLSARVRTGYP